MDDFFASMNLKQPEKKGSDGSSNPVASNFLDDPFASMNSKGNLS